MHHYRRAITGSICHMTLGLSIYLGMIPAQFSSSDYNTNLYTTGAMVLSLILSDWFLPTKIHTSIVIQKSAIFVLVFLQVIFLFLPIENSSKIVLEKPFQDQWLVFNGGNSPLVNHHFFFISQRYALDLVLKEDALVSKSRSKELTSYLSFGKEVLAPYSGEVVKLSNEFIDLQIGKTDLKNAFGNHLVIKIQENLYLGLGHLKKDSIRVKIGDKIIAGQVLAQCGNSGNTSQPHLHLQLMSKSELFDKDNLPIPMFFKEGQQKPKFYKRNDLL